MEDICNIYNWQKIRVWGIQEITQNQQEKDKQYNKMDEKRKSGEKVESFHLGERES